MYIWVHVLDCFPQPYDKETKVDTFSSIEMSWYDILWASGYLFLFSLRCNVWLRPGPCSNMQVYWVAWVPWQNKNGIFLKWRTWSAPGFTLQSCPDNAINRVHMKGLRYHLYKTNYSNWHIFRLDVCVRLSAVEYSLFNIHSAASFITLTLLLLLSLAIYPSYVNPSRADL